jgi:hypothetical protein
MDNTSDWGEVEAHIERHEGGCWTWDGSPVEGNVYRLVADACGIIFPIGRVKLYRMPACRLGKVCVNPNHIGTGKDYVRALNGRQQEIAGPSKTCPMVRLTRMDRQFLKRLHIRWE